MKKSLLDKWCAQPWLYTTYFCGIVMMNVLIICWNDWNVPQRLMGLLTVFLPLHVFEELTYPNGFHYMMNKPIQKSDERGLAFLRSLRGFIAVKYIFFKNTDVF